jgi:hypothetical protein
MCIARAVYYSQSLLNPFFCPRIDFPFQVHIFPETGKLQPIIQPRSGYGQVSAGSAALVGEVFHHSFGPLVTEVFRQACDFIILLAPPRPILCRR